MPDRLAGLDSEQNRHDCENRRAMPGQSRFRHAWPPRARPLPQSAGNSRGTDPDAAHNLNSAVALLALLLGRH
jgi:hypothetical protein